MQDQRAALAEIQLHSQQVLSQVAVSAAVAVPPVATSITESRLHAEEAVVQEVVHTSDCRTVDPITAAPGLPEPPVLQLPDGDEAGVRPSTLRAYGAVRAHVNARLRQFMAADMC